MNRTIMTRSEIELAGSLLKFCQDKGVILYFQVDKGQEFLYFYDPKADVVTELIRDLLCQMQHHIKAIFENDEQKIVNKARKILFKDKNQQR